MMLWRVMKPVGVGFIPHIDAKNRDGSFYFVLHTSLCIKENVINYYYYNGLRLALAIRLHTAPTKSTELLFWSLDGLWHLDMFLNRLELELLSALLFESVLWDLVSCFRLEKSTGSAMGSDPLVFASSEPSLLLELFCSLRPKTKDFADPRAAIVLAFWVFCALDCLPMNDGPEEPNADRGSDPNKSSLLLPRFNDPDPELLLLCWFCCSEDPFAKSSKIF